jgi:succinate-semialdehyde dehydrogenase/glutarate-semialdehyde dehydrogenase
VQSGRARRRTSLNLSPDPSTATIPTDAERLLIGGEWRGSVDASSLEVVDPATGEVVGAVSDAADSDITDAIDAAAKAFPAWRDTPARERGQLLRQAADLMKQRIMRIAEVMTAEQGKPLQESAAEVRYAAGFFEWFAGEAERIYGQVVPPVNKDKRVLVFRQPVGVTAAITPWNFPAAMLTRKLGPAIAAGCTSIVKPAAATPLTAIEICRAIEDAGAPPGLVNLITSSRAQRVAELLMSDPRVRKLSFTGSTEVGKHLIRMSADRVTRLSLELGGHAPFIVFDDADLEAALDQMMASKFRNAGQTCICANRIYVQSGIYRPFLDALASRTAALRVGPGRDSDVQIGPLIDARAVETVERHVEDAVRRGARLVVGGCRLAQGPNFYAPTVLDGITADMLISREETFGPVAGLTSFETEAEAIALANDTPYGLAAYVQTRDFARVFRIAERLDFGIVGVNDGAPSTPTAPFGGIKESGFGREGGAYGIDEYLNVKYISIGAVGD